MSSDPSKSLISIIEKRPNTPLSTTLIWSFVLGVLASSLIAKEAALNNRTEDMVANLIFALLFISAGVVTVWYQVRQVEKRLDAVASVLSERAFEFPIQQIDAAVEPKEDPLQEHRDENSMESKDDS
ncbi:MAG TPA: hypothetical protein PKD05_00020 [Candidatus Melainabacteria bacterium]|nr:hypothetical protein [Candidatus Melainabacteria bacterium]